MLMKFTGEMVTLVMLGSNWSMLEDMVEHRREEVEGEDTVGQDTLPPSLSLHHCMIRPQLAHQHFIVSKQQLSKFPFYASLSLVKMEVIPSIIH